MSYCPEGKKLSSWLEIEYFLEKNILLKQPLIEMIDEKLLFNRRKYLAFKIVDFIEFILNGHGVERAYTVDVTFTEDASSCFCYLLYWKNKALLLQFCESIIVKS
jgi:hypothetical protein